MIVPAVSAEEMADWVEGEPISILQNDSIASAARNERTGDTGIVFWEPGSVDGVTSENAVLLYKRPVSGGFSISVAEPSQISIRLRITFDGQFRVRSGSAQVVERTRTTTTVEVSVARGGSVTFVLEYLRARGVRR